MRIVQVRIVLGAIWPGANIPGANHRVPIVQVAIVRVPIVPAPIPVYDKPGAHSSHSHQPGTQFNVYNPFVSDEQLSWTLFEMFLGGTDTTSTTLHWGLLYMILYPKIQKNVQRELDEVVGRARAPCVRNRRNLRYTDATLLEVCI